MTSKIQLFVDWDETITAHDTLALIPPPNTTPPLFSELGKAYMDDLETFKVEFESRPAPSHEAIAKSYNLPVPAVGISDDLWDQLAHLDALDQVELASVRRTEESGIFVGWDPEQARRRACSSDLVQLRRGWSDIVAWLVRENRSARVVELHIISVSWSSTFIRAGLESHPASRLAPSTGLPTTLNANDPTLRPDGRGAGTLTKSITVQNDDSDDTHGRRLTGIRTGKHKLEVLRSLSLSSEDTITIYIGDSSTDLPCLLHAHIGILIGNQTGHA
ncbi:hypothetical protein V8E36_003570 [Tilletia maclaganii]